jgi:hypothetical protein
VLKRTPYLSDCGGDRLYVALNCGSSMRAEAMRQLWSFVGLKNNREILAWVGGGLAAVIAGLWTAFVSFSDRPKTTASTRSVQASCGVVSAGGMFGNGITAGNSGNCSEQKP